ncbi:MAG: M24 family metallopeptidase, partial [Bacillota bacterium]
LIVSDFELVESRQLAVGCELLGVEPGAALDAAGGILRGTSPDRLGYSVNLTHREFTQLQSMVVQRGLCRQLVVMNRFDLQLRGVKDEQFLDQIIHCCRITEAAFERVLQVIEPGITELDLAAEIEWALRKGGAGQYAFPTVVASGPRSAGPHAMPTERTLREGDLVVLDFGVRVGAGTSDFARTLVLGEADGEQRQIYESVFQAQEAALNAIEPGRSGAEIHAAAERHLAAVGYSCYLSHGLGHSLAGGPDLVPDESELLVPGNVVAVEPGVYIPGWGGVRLEDVVLVTEAGHRALTRCSPRLIEV